MTEHEWLTSEDPWKMLTVVSPTLSMRKRGLWCVALFRLSTHKYSGWADFIERWDEGEEYERTTLSMCMGAWGVSACDEEGDPPMAIRAAALRDVVGNPWRPARLPYRGPGGEGEVWYRPGDPARFDADARCPYLTPDVLSLARAAYDERTEDGTLDLFRLHLVADALEDAGVSDVESPCPTCSPYADDPCPRRCSVLPNPVGLRGKSLRWKQGAGWHLCPDCRGTGKFPPGYHPERDPASGRHEGGWTNCKTCNGGGNRSAVRPGVVRTPHPLLGHLRSGGTHVRGCYAIDLLLGLE